VCRHGSWLKHYYAETGSTRTMCSVLGCSNDVDVGAHIHNAHGLARNHHWIVLMCHQCNMSNDALRLKGDVKLISANTQQMGCYRPMSR
jgi:hypothetical protein